MLSHCADVDSGVSMQVVLDFYSRYINCRRNITGWISEGLWTLRSPPTSLLQRQLRCGPIWSTGSPTCSKYTSQQSNAGVFRVWDCGPPRRQSLEKGTTSPPLVYLLSLAHFLDAYALMIMLFDPIDTQQLSLDSLIFRLHKIPEKGLS